MAFFPLEEISTTHVFENEKCPIIFAANDFYHLYNVWMRLETNHALKLAETRDSFPRKNAHKPFDSALSPQDKKENRVEPSSIAPKWLLWMNSRKADAAAAEINTAEILSLAPSPPISPFRPFLS